MKVAVIGGGWAGIAAAVELTAAGIETTLFEAGRTLGGRAREITIDGHRLDNGQHILLGAYRETLTLMRQVGGDPQQLLERHPLRIIDNTGFHMALPRLPAPLNVAWGLLTAKGIRLGEKLKTARWMEGVKKCHFQLAENCTVASWLDAAGQIGPLRQHLWEPLCLAAMNTPAERASAQLFANVLRDSLGSARREDTDLLLPRATLGKLLPEPASHWLTSHGARLRLGTRIGPIRPGESTIELAGESFDAAILATAPQHATKLWPELDIAYDYEPIATIYLQADRSIRLPFPLFNQTGKFGQWVVDRGDGLLACILSGHGEWEILDDQALSNALQEELGMHSPSSWYKVIREKRATFSCRPGIARPAWRTSHPRLLLAGDYTWADYPATLEGAVRSGRRAAEHILDQKKGPFNGPA